MRFILCFLSLIWASFSNAAVIFPSGCQGRIVQGDEITIEGKKAQVLFLHNITQTDLWITHPESEHTTHMSATSRLQADHWSALVVDKNPFTLGCIESRPGHEQQVPCAQVVVMCAWNKMKIPTPPQGPFWVGEDMTVAELKTALGTVYNATTLAKKG